MKSPERMPDDIASISNSGTEPSIQVSEAGASSLAQEIAPSQTPPDTASGQGGGIGATVSYTDKRVNGLYTTFNARNSWMSITGTGWVKLATASDSACEAMTILAAHARTKLSRLDYVHDGTIATEVYAW